MVLDAKYRHIFILGRYLEKGLRDESRNVKVEEKLPKSKRIFCLLN